MFRSKIFLFTLLFSAVLARSATPILSLDDTSNPDQGILKLNWQYAASEHQEFELHQATSSNFQEYHSVYEGSDLATFISGLEDGTYYYRVFHPPSETYSKTLRIQVKHHSLYLAFTMLGLGALVFIFTLIILLKGPQKNISNK